MNLNHVAIIPDGNRRWARAHGLDTIEGHRKGMETIEPIMREAKKIGVKYLTAWGCSKDNLEKRTMREVKYLYSLFGEYFEKLIKDEEIHSNQVKIRVIGEWFKYFPSPLRSLAKKIEKVTDKYLNYNFTLLMAYDGKREMQSAFENAGQGRGNNLAKYLWTRDLPPVDLVIRTGEKSNLAHWSSGFLMWQTADSEFYFTKTMWPAFGTKEFHKAVDLYNSRTRNLGK